MVIITISDIIALTAIIFFSILLGIVFLTCKYSNYKNKNGKISGYLLLINKTNSSDNFKARDFKNKSEIEKFFKSENVVYGSQYDRYLVIKFKSNYYNYLITYKDYNYIKSIINDSEFE